MRTGFANRIDDLSYWKEQAAKMNDSLRIDSITKSAYAKGVKAANDSLKVIK